jgi:hypothetical protein
MLENYTNNYQDDANNEEDEVYPLQSRASERLARLNYDSLLITIFYC